VPTIRAVRRTHSQSWATHPADLVLDAARRIIEQSGLRWAAYELIRFHRVAFAAVDDEILAGLAVGLDSWDSVDAFARTLSGPAWAQGRMSDRLVDRWAASPDRWLRRAALVSTVALNRPNEGGRVDPKRTLAVCEMLVGDRDDMVVKGLSWALRELGRQDPEPVRAFLERHDAALAARVRREVGNKLRTGLKNPRLRSRS
jgi:3-methyladenine DNA glycosylase AlkD